MLFFKKLVNRVYTLKIGTRTALSFFAVVFVALFFSVAATLLLQYSKNIDIRISSSFSPVISAIRDYQFLIEESGRIAQDLTEKYDENKRIRLEKILNVQYNRSKVTVIGLCQEPDLEGIKNRIIETDKEFQNVKDELLKLIVFVKENKTEYDKAFFISNTYKTLNYIDPIIANIKFKLSETNLEAIKAFRKLEAQKYASYRTLSYLLLIMIVVIILVSTVSIYLTRVTIIKPIKELSHILTEIGKGKIITFEAGVKRLDEIGFMIKAMQNVVEGFKQKAIVANAIGKGNYKITVPLLSKDDRLGKALEEMRRNLNEAQSKLENNLKALEDYAKNLEKKNKELDQFAYITSHDLKSPLRGINNLAEWIMEDMGDQMPPDSKKYFELLRGRVHRMEALIDSILKFSRAGRSVEEKELVQTKNVVLKCLYKLNPDNKYRIFFDEKLPAIYGNRKDIDEVFLNFISNAILHNTNPEPIVNITFKHQAEEYIFCVADNGPGIAPEFHQKIFTIFQTLEARDKVESVGAGLAIVKKIIESYNGKVWLESELGKGSKFYFTWPAPTVKENTNTTHIVEPIVSKPVTKIKTLHLN
ncbi:MAG: sensor histidine kinase [Bacteroidia bacterium]